MLLVFANYGFDVLLGFCEALDSVADVADLDVFVDVAFSL